MLVFSQSSAAAWSDLIFDGGWENCKATGRDPGEDMVAMFKTDKYCPQCYVLRRRLPRAGTCMSVVFDNEIPMVLLYMEILHLLRYLSVEEGMGISKAIRETQHTTNSL